MGVNAVDFGFAGATAVVTCTVVTIAEVHSHLPGDTPVVIPQGRAAVIARRRAYVTHRFNSAP
jgi:hypothetical protein